MWLTNAEVRTRASITGHPTRAPIRYSLGFMRLNFRLGSDISGLELKPDTDSIGPFRQRGTFFLISAPKNEPTSAVFLFIEISVRNDRT